MYTASLSQASRASEGIVERRCRGHPFYFALSSFRFPFPNFTQSLILPAAFLFGLLFSSSVKVFIPTTFTHTLQFGSAQLCLVQCRQPVGLLLCTTTREGAITRMKVPDCLCVCVCVFQTDPLIHRTAAHLVCLLTRQK